MRSGFTRVLDVITMTTGVDWIEDHRDPQSLASRLAAGLIDATGGTRELLRTVRPHYAPGSRYEYCTADSQVLDWIREQRIRHLAVHFDLDVLDPAHFRPLLFNQPDAPEGAFEGIPRGRLRLGQVVRLLNDVAGATDVVGLAITEHLPWDVLELRNALRRLPLLA